MIGVALPGPGTTAWLSSSICTAAAPPSQRRAGASPARESRVFGHDGAARGRPLRLEEFRSRLIDAIRRGETTVAPILSQAWRCAFESLLTAKGVCASGDLEARTRALVARPPGHDHG
jgi:hypothetical protein